MIFYSLFFIFSSILFDHASFADVDVPQINQRSTTLDTCGKDCRTLGNDKVCDTNGKSYINKCYFEIASCLNKDLVLAKGGTCTFSYPKPRYIACSTEKDCARQLGGKDEHWTCGGATNQCIKAGCKLDKNWNMISCINDCHVVSPSSKGMCIPTNLPTKPTPVPITLTSLDKVVSLLSHFAEGADVTNEQMQFVDMAKTLGNVFKQMSDEIRSNIPLIPDNVTNPPVHPAILPQDGPIVNTQMKEEDTAIDPVVELENDPVEPDTEPDTAVEDIPMDHDHDQDYPPDTELEEQIDNDTAHEVDHDGDHHEPAVDTDNNNANPLEEQIDNDTAYEIDHDGDRHDPAVDTDNNDVNPIEDNTEEDSVDHEAPNENPVDGAEENMVGTGTDHLGTETENTVRPAVAMEDLKKLSKQLINFGHNSNIPVNDVRVVSAAKVLGKAFGQIMNDIKPSLVQPAPNEPPA